MLELFTLVLAFVVSVQADLRTFSAAEVDLFLNETVKSLQLNEPCQLALHQILTAIGDNNTDVMNEGRQIDFVSAFTATTYNAYRNKHHDRFMYRSMECVEAAGGDVNKKNDMPMHFCYAHSTDAGQSMPNGSMVPMGSTVAVCMPSACLEYSRQVAQAWHDANMPNHTLDQPVCMASKWDQQWYVEPFALVQFGLEMVLMALCFGACWSTTLFPKSQNRLAVRFLNAFTFTTNFKKLFRIPCDPSATVSCLVGIRVISMVWCVIGHSYMAVQPFIQDITTFKNDLASNYFTILITNFTLCVDTFFVLSGCLTAYSFFTKIVKNDQSYVKVSWNSWAFWLRFYRHRLVRLWPLYTFALFNITLRLSKVHSHPTWPLCDPSVQCSNTWWHNLLFLNSIIPDSACMVWTWYLANDFIYFVFSPVLLLIFKANRRAGSTVIIVGCIAACIIRAVLIHINNWPPTVMFWYQPDNFNIDVAAYFMQMYVKPHTRFATYLVGIQLGHTLAHSLDTSNDRKQYGWAQSLGMWSLAALLGLGALLGLYPALHNLRFDVWAVYHIVYASCYRLCFALSVFIVVYMCHSGRAYYLNRLLSCLLWVPLANTSYGVYLYHLMPIIGTYLWSPLPYIWQGHGYHLLVYGLFHVAGGWMSGITATMLVEVPSLNIERILLGTAPKSGAHKPITGVCKPCI